MGARSGCTRAVARRYGSMRRARNEAPVSNSTAAVDDFAKAACMKASWRPTVAAVSGMTHPRASCDFHSSCRSGGKYSIANAASNESDARTAGTRSAFSAPTCISHCTSVTFREASARQSAATRRRPSARFTQYSEGPPAPARCRTTRRRERHELRNGPGRDEPGSLEKIADLLPLLPLKNRTCRCCPS